MRGEKVREGKGRKKRADGGRKRDERRQRMGRKKKVVGVKREEKGRDCFKQRK